MGNSKKLGKYIPKKSLNIWSVGGGDDSGVWGWGGAFEDLEGE